MIDDLVKEVEVFAPATVANVAVGFDVLGFAIDGLGDTVVLTRVDQPGVRIVEITPNPGIPTEPATNTATAGLLYAISDFNVSCGFEVRIRKGIPLSSGMGGSAASAVAGLVALNAFFHIPIPPMQLLHYCVIGESMASGARHADNVAPALLGGFQLARSLEPIDVVSIPVPDSLWSVVVHPEHKVETKTARGILQKQVALKDHVQSSADLGAVIAGCYRGDLDLLRRSVRDLLIEPQRSLMIPGFAAVKDAALRQGAIGCSISGAGPSVFAWAEGESQAQLIMASMVAAFMGEGVNSQGFVSRVGAPGARIVRRS